MGFLLRCVGRYLNLHQSRSWLSSSSSPLGGRNILLMGLPGAGKTSVGRIVADRLGLPAVDVDDHVLEPAWQMPVASKLASLGGERFLEEEGRALRNFSASGCVVSLTGSNPLHGEAMRHASETGLVVYLDVDGEDVVRRLAQMKVDRIVGQEAGVPIRDILRYRKQFYEKWLDVRVLVGVGDTVEDVAEKVLEAVERYDNPDAYVSTRGDGEGSARFSDAVVEGLAPDGGLYVPERGLPLLAANEWLRLVDMSYAERAAVLLEKCIHPLDVGAPDLRAMASEAYGANFSSPDVAPVRHLQGDVYVQELFHGPTASFKDLALQLMPRLFAHCLPPACNYLVLVATSGDTGSAVLSGFAGLSRAERQKTGVLVFFPEDGVSHIQKLQILRYGAQGNARATSVRADFDFCQRSVKRMLGQSELAAHLATEYATVLSTANSINWARLLPQLVYHSSSYLDLCKSGVISFGEPLDVCVPTGNFGNAMSALYAKRMGVPIRKVICASNRNRIVADFISTGEYDLRGRRLVPSLSPAIDILKSSNLERFIFQVSGGDGRLVRDLFTRLDAHGHFRVAEPLLARVRQEVEAGWCSEDDCLDAIRAVHAQTGYVMDTHTAVGKVVAERLRDGRCPLVVCATAHYGKFAPAVFKALGIHSVPEDPVEQLRTLGSSAARPGLHSEMVKCLEEPSRGRHAVCEAEYGVLVEEVENMIHDSFLKVH